MTKVLFILHGLSKGGAERVAGILSKYLADEFGIIVGIFNKVYGVDYPYGGHMFDLKTPFSRSSAKNNILIRIFRLGYLVFSLKKIKKKLGIRISISFLDNANVANLLSIESDTTIISIRNYRSKEDSKNKLYGTLYKYMTKILYNRAYKIVVPSMEIKKDLIDNYNLIESKILCIYNPCDIKKISNLMSEKLEDQFLKIY